MGRWKKVERETRVDPRVSFPGVGAKIVSGGGVEEEPVIEQVKKSLEHHCYCSLTPEWFGKMVAGPRAGLAPEYREAIARIREKWEEAGTPERGLFIVRACELGLCREEVKETDSEK